MTLAGFTFASFQFSLLISPLPCQTTILWSMKINIFPLYLLNNFFKTPTGQDDIQDNTQLSKFL